MQEMLIEKTSGDLTIPSGTRATLPAGFKGKFNNITIEAQARLVITGEDNKWTCLWAEGNFIVAGRIVATGFKIPSGSSHTISDKAADGHRLTYEFIYDRFGGDGGPGGYWNGGDLRGGANSIGGPNYGGGGGGGAGNDGRRRGRHEPGHNASGWSGGAGGHVPGYVGGRGGDGGLNDAGDGGLLYLRADGDFNGTDAKIRLNGQNGDSGDSGNSSQSAGGGGGGGAPGCHGGCLILRFGSGLILPNVNVKGGSGGSRAVGGRCLRDFPGAGAKIHGLAGQGGRSGRDGTFSLLGTSGDPLDGTLDKAEFDTVAQGAVNGL